jgi:hypothetical protein
MDPNGPNGPNGSNGSNGLAADPGGGCSVGCRDSSDRPQPDFAPPGASGFYFYPVSMRLPPLYMKESLRGGFLDSGKIRLNF